MKSSGIKLGKAKFRLSIKKGEKKNKRLIMRFIIPGISLSGEMMETPA